MSDNEIIAENKRLKDENYHLHDYDVKTQYEILKMRKALYLMAKNCYGEYIAEREVKYWLNKANEELIDSVDI